MERENYIEKHGVIFAIWDGEKIQLEIRKVVGTKYYGYTLIPGGGVEEGETLQEALLREIKEEYGVKAVEFSKIGPVFETENGVLSVRHLYLITKWEGRLSNPEGKNDHIESSIDNARELCKHHLTQTFLSMIEKKIISG